MRLDVWGMESSSGELHRRWTPPCDTEIETKKAVCTCEVAKGTKPLQNPMCLAQGSVPRQAQVPHDFGPSNHRNKHAN